jgi:hypothetical protein
MHLVEFDIQFVYLSIFNIPMRELFRFRGFSSLLLPSLQVSILFFSFSFSTQVNGQYCPSLINYSPRHLWFISSPAKSGTVELNRGSLSLNTDAATKSSTEIACASGLEEAAAQVRSPAHLAARTFSAGSGDGGGVQHRVRARTGGRGESSASCVGDWLGARGWRAAAPAGGSRWSASSSSARACSPPAAALDIGQPVSC